MAFGGNQKINFTENICSVTSIDVLSNETNIDENLRKTENFAMSCVREPDDIVNSSNRDIDGACSNIGDRKLNDFVDNISEKFADDVNQSSDSLSSSASISDSDFTSTDSDDSLALSESESITDVTPLNSPYCDSPLPQSRHIEYKSEERNLTNPCKNVDFECIGDNCHRPEMNILMKAIEKLELEAKSNSDCAFRETIIRRRASSFSNEETKRIEQENQRLIKKVISQQNRIRSIYSASNQPGTKTTSKNQDLVKSDGDISGTPKKSIMGKFSKQADKSPSYRRQKCLSHPSSYIYSCNHLMDKSLLPEDLCSEENGKKKHISPAIKIACSQDVKTCCDEVTSNSGKMD